MNLKRIFEALDHVPPSISGELCDHLDQTCSIGSLLVDAGRSRDEIRSAERETISVSSKEGVGVYYERLLKKFPELRDTFGIMDEEELLHIIEASDYYLPSSDIKVPDATLDQWRTQVRDALQIVGETGMSYQDYLNASARIDYDE